MALHSANGLATARAQPLIQIGLLTATRTSYGQVHRAVQSIGLRT